jgi:hypothetical protein
MALRQQASVEHQQLGFRIVEVRPALRVVHHSEASRWKRDGVESGGAHHTTVLAMEAHGGGGNAFGRMAAPERLRELDATLAHVWGAAAKGHAPEKTAAVDTRKETAAGVDGNAAAMLRAYSPLLDGAMGW